MMHLDSMTYDVSLRWAHIHFVGFIMRRLNSVYNPCLLIGADNDNMLNTKLVTLAVIKIVCEVTLSSIIHSGMKKNSNR